MGPFQIRQALLVGLLAPLQEGAAEPRPKVPDGPDGFGVRG
jgi:hypothetical protein